MHVRVRLFAIHRERAGLDHLEIELPPDSTVADLLTTVTRRVPGLDPFAATTRFAVNRAYAPATTVLKDGDEVALIPPVAGGGPRHGG